MKLLYTAYNQHSKFYVLVASVWSKWPKIVAIELKNERCCVWMKTYIYYCFSVLCLLNHRSHNAIEADGVTKIVNALYTGSSKKMDGIWNRYNLKSTGRIYTFGVLKCSEKFKVLNLHHYICKLIILN